MTGDVDMTDLSGLTLTVRFTPGFRVRLFVVRALLWVIARIGHITVIEDTTDAAVTQDTTDAPPHRAGR